MFEHHENKINKIINGMKCHQGLLSPLSTSGGCCRNIVLMLGGQCHYDGLHEEVGNNYAGRT